MQPRILTIILALGFLFSGSVHAQQESQYTQFMYNKLMLNPAYAGYGNGPMLNFLYRKQYIGLYGSPESKLASFSSRFLSDNVGFGLVLSNHTVGISNKWYATMSYAYVVQLSKTTALRFGLSGSIRQYAFDFTDPKLYIRQDGDPNIAYDDVYRKLTGNFGGGVYLQHDAFYVGVSAPYFFPNELSLNENAGITAAKETSHFYGMAGVRMKLTEHLSLHPAGLLKYVKNAPTDLDLNLSAVYDEKLSFGAGYRVGGTGAGESVNLMAGYRFGKVRCGLSYDLNTSAIRPTNSGSVEAFLLFDFAKERNNMANPRFFK